MIGDNKYGHQSKFFPIHLDLPTVYQHVKTQSWNLMMKKLEKEEAITNFPIYYLLIFKCLMVVAHKLEKIQKDFLGEW